MATVSLCKQSGVERRRICPQYFGFGVFYLKILLLDVSTVHEQVAQGLSDVLNIPMSSTSSFAFITDSSNTNQPENWLKNKPANTNN